MAVLGASGARGGLLCTLVGIFEWGVEGLGGTEKVWGLVFERSALFVVGSELSSKWVGKNGVAFARGSCALRARGLYRFCCFGRLRGVRQKGAC